MKLSTVKVPGTSPRAGGRGLPSICFARQIAVLVVLVVLAWFAPTVNAAIALPADAYTGSARMPLGGSWVMLAAALAAAASTGADTQAPTAPALLAAAAISSGQLNLSWGSSTDNVGVGVYSVERCQGASCTSFLEVATLTGTSFTDAGLASGITYRYRVRARDDAGNFSVYSVTVNATTPPAADSQAPMLPSDPSIFAASVSRYTQPVRSAQPKSLRLIMRPVPAHLPPSDRVCYGADVP